MSIPAHRIYMCKGVPLSSDYKHTLIFDTIDKHLEYMHGKVAKTFSSYTFIRDTWSVKVEATYEEARTWNYLFYQGGAGKIYFAFINRIGYINDACVEVFFEVDVMQTYMFNYTLKQCFVEREHSATDNIGDNLIDEGLELGDFVTVKQTNVDMQSLCILVLTSINPNTGDDGLYATSINGVFSGLRIYAADPKLATTIGEMLKELDADGVSDGIFSMWMYPKKLVKLKESESWDDDGNVFKVVTGVQSFDIEIDRTISMVASQCTNMKMYTFPYNYMYVSNNAGGAAVYKYEFFNNPKQCVLRLKGALSPEASVKMFPVGYKDVPLNYEEGLMLGGYPTCAWQQDAYKLWLAQNQNQQNLGLVFSGLTIAAGVGTMIATGGATAAVGGGAVASGIANIANTLAQRADKDIQPPQARGNFSANVNIVSEFQTFTIQQRMIDEEHLRLIDEYFTRFGYATKRIKVPNTKVRKAFTYVKTADCQIIADLGSDIIQKIESVYNNGVTIWRDPSLVGVYTCDNSCL